MIINSSRNCVGSAVIYWITVAILIYSEHGIAQQASLAFIDSTTISSWSMLLSASVGNIKDSLATFGVRPDAIYGYDPQYDVPRPPDPPGDYIKVYFPHAGSGWPSMLGTKYMSDLCSPKDPAWVFKVETNIVGNPTIVLSWDTTRANKLPDGYLIMMRDSIAGVNISIRNQNSYSFLYSGTRTFSIWVEYEATFFDVASGWNLISLPRIVQESSKVLLFPTSGTDAFSYDEVYIVQNYLQNGKGYWLQFGTHQLVSIAGLDLDAIEIPVSEGWNLIGTVNHQIPAPIGGVICSNIFGYEGSYTPVDSLKPGKGYWVKANSEGIITFGSHQSASFKKTTFLPDNLVGVLTIKDQKQKDQILYITDNDSVSSMYELPPLPPQGEFDARFSSNRYVETYHNFFIEPMNLHIKVQSSHYPISITASIPGSAIIFSLRELNGSTYGCTHQLYDGVTIKIEDTQVHELQIVASGQLNKPNQFFLKQNHPNPWNPTTIIEYGLPERALVRLSIYDILGKETFCLVDEIKESGQYQVVVDGNKLRLNSGVFYYKCIVDGYETGLKYNNTKKFIFLK